MNLVLETRSSFQRFRKAACVAVITGALLSLAAFAATPALPADDTQLTVKVGDQTRACLVHVPPAHGGARLLPLVIVLHGSGGTGENMAKMTGFSAMGDKHGFITAFPDGILAKHNWNSLFGNIPGGEGILADDVDDVAFIRALIDTLGKSHHIDPNRVFVCGHSAGAYMTYRLAVDLADRIAAAGIVNGSLGIKSADGKPCQADIPKPLAPISIIQISCKKDNVVKFAGGQAPKNLYKSAPDCIQFFVQADGCATPGKETRDAQHGVARTLYSKGKGGTEVELVIVENCNQSWPVPAVGLSATQELWDFFSKHPKAAR